MHREGSIVGASKVVGCIEGVFHISWSCKGDDIVCGISTVGYAFAFPPHFGAVGVLE